MSALGFDGNGKDEKKRKRGLWNSFMTKSAQCKKKGGSHPPFFFLCLDG